MNGIYPFPTNGRGRTSRLLMNTCEKGLLVQVLFAQLVRREIVGSGRQQHSGERSVSQLRELRWIADYILYLQP